MTEHAQAGQQVAEHDEDKAGHAGVDEERRQVDARDGEFTEHGMNKTLV